MTLAAGSTGRFTLDLALVVRTWDGWMAAATGIPEVAACGTSIASLYPDLAERGFLARLRQVAGGAGVQVLAPALHKYLLPCAPLDPTSRFSRMRQHVVIAPITDDDGTAGVAVTIEDVTARFDRERSMAADLDSDSEIARLRTATQLAHDGRHSAILSDALADESWRVRRVAAEGLAGSDDPEVTASLLQALREHHRNPALLNSVLTTLGRTRQDIVADVIPLLRGDDIEVRMYGALALGLIGDIRATPPLLAVLDADPDMNVRFHAIEALGRVGDRRAAETLAAIANQRDFFLTFPALDALALIGDPFVAPGLLTLLDDEILAPAAAACLGHIGSDDVVVPLVAAMGRENAPVAELGSAIAEIARRFADDHGDESLIPALVRRAATQEIADALRDAIEHASDEDVRGLVLVASWLPYPQIDVTLAAQLKRPTVRRLAADRLGQRGVVATPFVEALASDDDTEVRCAAAYALGAIGSASSVPALLSMLDDGPPSALIIVVATALGSIGDASPFPRLFALLDHAETTVRQAVIGAVSSIAHPAMEASVAAAFDDPSPRLRESAARIAGYFSYESCLDRVIKCCDDADAGVRRAAVESLATFDDERALVTVRRVILSDPDPTVRAAAVRALAGSDWSEAETVLHSALQDANLWVRYYAARASGRLAALNDELAAALVSRVETDRAAPVRVAAIEALAPAASPRALASLLQASRDADDDVSAAALRALGGFPLVETIDPLERALATGSARQRRAALDAIGTARHADHGAIPHIVRAAADRHDEELSSAAIAALGRMGPEAIESLLSLGTTPARRDAVVRALIPNDDDALATIVDVLPAASDEAKELLILALGRVPGGRGAAPIAPCLSDSSLAVRRTAERALQQIDRLRAE